MYVIRDFPAFLKVAALPTNYLVSRSGKIAWGANFVSPDMTDILDALLADRPSAVQKSTSHK
jgi:hypothetical protein